MKKTLATLGTVIASTGLVFAQANAGAGGLNSVIVYVSDTINKLTIVVVAAAVLVFGYGILVYIFNLGKADSKAEGRKLMIWGIIGIFVMVAVWGLVQFLATTTGVSTGNSGVVPSTPIVPR